jgi:hypothetical protein
MFCGIILIHRAITFIPTYSDFKYESLTLTNVILAFLVLVLSIQTKIGIKVNILFDRVVDFWNGSSSSDDSAANYKKKVRVSQPVSQSRHVPSQGDSMDSIQGDMFPPAPIVTSNKPTTPSVNTMMSAPGPEYYGPMAANSVLGGAFGSSF